MKRRSRQPISNINVVPYLDVLLVLLVIFMVTAPLFNQGVVDVPEAGERALPAAPVALVIEYEKSAEGRYRLIDHKEGTESGELNDDELIDELDKKAVLYGEPPVIVISADGVLPYEDVMHLLGRLRDAGHTKLALSARTGSR